MSLGLGNIRLAFITPSVEFRGTWLDPAVCCRFSNVVICRKRPEVVTSETFADAMICGRFLDVICETFADAMICGKFPDLICGRFPDVGICGKFRDGLESHMVNPI